MHTCFVQNFEDLNNSYIIRHLDDLRLLYLMTEIRHKYHFYIAVSETIMFYLKLKSVYYLETNTFKYLMFNVLYIPGNSPLGITDNDSGNFWDQKCNFSNHTHDT